MKTGRCWDPLPPPEAPQPPPKPEIPLRRPQAPLSLIFASSPPGFVSSLFPCCHPKHLPWLAGQQRSEARQLGARVATQTHLWTTKRKGGKGEGRVHHLTVDPSLITQKSSMQGAESITWAIKLSTHDRRCPDVLFLAPRRSSSAPRCACRPATLLYRATRLLRWPTVEAVLPCCATTSPVLELGGEE